MQELISYTTIVQRSALIFHFSPCNIPLQRIGRETVWLHTFSERLRTAQRCKKLPHCWAKTKVVTAIHTYQAKTVTWREPPPSEHCTKCSRFFSALLCVWWSITNPMPPQLKLTNKITHRNAKDEEKKSKRELCAAEHVHTVSKCSEFY